LRVHALPEAELSIVCGVHVIFGTFGAPDRCHHIADGAGRVALGFADGFLPAPLELAGKLSFLYRHSSRVASEQVEDILRQLFNKDC
jgi:hypothetical protein